MTPHIAIIDLGGQYCHLISRRLRDLGVRAVIRESDVSPGELRGCAGVILSGGPSSVYDHGAPTIDDGVLQLGVPVLGICYGHQLLVQKLGGIVEHSKGEYGASDLTLAEQDTIFSGLPTTQRVWMSHADSVTRLPPEATRLAETERCPNAAFAMFGRGFFGVQFHPEVVHTDHGSAILQNFTSAICGIHSELDRSGRLDELIGEIRDRVGGDSVFFLVSGGVDSTVAFVLCARALPADRILGLYVDTGLMRTNETEELRENLESLGLLHRLKIRDESKRFLRGLAGVTDPEEKREIIGRLFVEVQAEAMVEYGIDSDHWLLGQGTIYPDTIESGGDNGKAALIKTHHNRCREIRELMERGRVIEPLSEFYKDEVRELGLELGLRPELTHRWPFPGPGLAIRCLCSVDPEMLSAEPLDVAVHLPSGFKAVRLPLSSVGVQGDGRTYKRVAAVSGPTADGQYQIDYDALADLSGTLCNGSNAYNRVIYLLGSHMQNDLAVGHVIPSVLSPARIDLLREADHLVRNILESEGLTDSVWQFPVVLVPLRLTDGESFVLRPVNSTDGMTANFARLPVAVIQRMAREILGLRGVDAVFLDITDKPPATIEWE